jgi:hypothetical protein
MPVYYKLYTTFISSTVTWSRHDVTGKLLIWYKTTITHSNQLSKGWIISNSRFNCFNSLSLFTNYCFHTLEIFSSKYGRECSVCFYFNHWFCKDDLTFARHINIQITNTTNAQLTHYVFTTLQFGQVPFLRENYVATTYFRYVICKSLWQRIFQRFCYVRIWSWC